MEQRRTPEIALEKLRRIMSRIFHDNEPQMTLSIHRIAPIRKILEGAWETIQVFICACEGIDIAEPDQVAGATITPSLQFAHTTSIASVGSVLEPHDRNDVSTQLDEAVQNVERGQRCVGGVVSLASWLPSIQIVPRQLVLLVLAGVVFGRKELRGENAHFSIRSSGIGILCFTDGVVQCLPVTVSIPELAVQNNVEMLDRFVIQVFSDEPRNFLIAFVADFE
ncbi:hypothetical protein N7452_009546 [Penicillium brevicompactum]|uniref:Uncharacterized protein n=1 Tax=Penicillium brevicompactum TaxID=5074 RepID=A0A9W9Q8M0_PENBR|nr:hypothetical protein N7452_009546 [Penicillium brevicompactum]